MKWSSEVHSTADFTTAQNLDFILNSRKLLDE